MAVRNRVLIALRKAVGQDPGHVSLHSRMQSLLEDNLEALSFQHFLREEFGQEITLPPSFMVMQLARFIEHVERELEGD